MERPDIIATRIVWGEPIEGTARELLNEAEPNNGSESKTEIAERFLKEHISPGEKWRSNEIEDLAEKCGISRRTLKRAKPGAKVTSFQAKGQWWWERQ
jgi:putative DNA primase/helicase